MVYQVGCCVDHGLASPGAASVVEVVRSMAITSAERGRRQLQSMETGPVLVMMASCE
jgi:hypothetical protein